MRIDDLNSAIDEMFNNKEEKKKDVGVTKKVESAAPSQLNENPKDSNKILEVTNCISLNVRKAPDKKADVIMTLKEGSKVVMMSKANDYCRVELPDKRIGYILSKFTKEV